MKLLELLVQELPKRGGWPIDSDDERTLMASLPEVLWRYDGGLYYAFRGPDDGVNYKQYEAALAASEGWIEWGGGECPVDDEALVDIKFNDGPELDIAEEAGAYDWHNISEPHIIAYRLHKPDINSRANDDRLEQDLNECIGQDVDMSEWNGNGVPPAGIDIEYRLTKVNYRNDFSRGKVIAYGISNVFMEHWSSKNEFIQPLDKIEFRPIRSEADKKRDAAIIELSSVIDYRNGCSSKPLAGWLYDAIAAGKIPGVKLSD